jgi:hypothetical protein
LQAPARARLVEDLRGQFEELAMVDVDAQQGPDYPTPSLARLGDWHHDQFGHICMP